MMGDYLKDLSMNGKMLLKFILQKHGRRVWIGLIGCSKELSVICFKPSASIQGRELLHQFSVGQLLAKYMCVCVCVQIYRVSGKFLCICRK
jgi:hypothetical protein